MILPFWSIVSTGLGSPSRYTVEFQLMSRLSFWVKLGPPVSTTRKPPCASLGRLWLSDCHVSTHRAAVWIVDPESPVTRATLLYLRVEFAPASPPPQPQSPFE